MDETCIAGSLLCDDVIDCPDGEDEADCYKEGLDHFYRVRIEPMYSLTRYATYKQTVRTQNMRSKKDVTQYL